MEPNKLREELKTLVEQGNVKFVFRMNDGSEKKLRLFISTYGLLCYYRYGKRKRGYPVENSFLKNVQSYRVPQKRKKDRRTMTPLEQYMYDLTEWKRYILKHHISGIWDKLKNKAESISVESLVALKLMCSDSSHTLNDVLQVARQLGLPEFEKKTRTLKQLHCTYEEEIKNAIDKREDFDYSWAIPNSPSSVDIVGRKCGNDYKVWVIVDDKQYYLLDYNHMLIINDENDEFKE